jgi:hypothetical protein
VGVFAVLDVFTESVEMFQAAQDLRIRLGLYLNPFTQMRQSLIISHARNPHRTVHKLRFYPPDRQFQELSHHTKG